MEYHLAALWFLAFAALSLLGQPLAARLFPRFPRLGSAFGLPLALAVLGLVAFWVGRLSLAAGTWGGVALLVALAATLTRRGYEFDARAVGETLAVFGVAFAVMVAMRALDPAAHAAGGEKFLDFGLLRSLLRADHLPVEDFWFAGESLRYYYGGHLVGSALARLTFTPASYAYNLLLAGYFGALVSAAYGLGGALVAQRESARRREHDAVGGLAGFVGTLLALPAFLAGLVVRAGAFVLLVPLTVREQLTGEGGNGVERVRRALEWRERFAGVPIPGWTAVHEVATTSRRRTAGVLAAFLVGFTGTLATPARMLLGVAIRDFGLSPETRRTVGEAVLGGIRAPLDAVLVSQTTPFTFNYWYGRYVIPDAITVFPLWEWVNGDLHAHMMSTPFLLTVAACCLAYFRTPARERGQRWLLLSTVGLLAGLLALVNLWSLPTALGLSALTVALAPAHPVTLLPGRERFGGSRTLDELSRPFAAVPVAGVLGVLAVLVGSPFLLFHRPESQGIGWLPPRSAMVPLFLVYGAFLLVFAGVLLARVRGRLGTPAAVVAALVGLAGVVVAGLTDLAVVGLVGPLLGGGWMLARAGASDAPDDPTARHPLGTTESDGGRTALAPYEPVLLVAGAGLVVAVEFAYAKVWPHDPNAIRWNTVYKVSMQVWLLWGVATGGFLARALGGLRDRTASTASDGDGYLSRASGAWALRAGIALLLVSAGGFGVLGGGWQLAGPFVSYNDTSGEVTWTGDDVRATLDATRFVRDWHPREAEAIEWLNAREGTPNMMTMPGVRSPEYGCTGIYQWVNAPSTFSGVPTLAGWEHERGYRGDEAYFERVDAVVAVYIGSWADATETFREYDVEYVYVGPKERECFGRDLREFEGHSGISTAFENEGVTIYEVNRTALNASEG
ncbi:DUF2298 domain-containing protein [Halomarina litorea]|uniref:DUF2298 domain-containing protein n=1 Tax=Halomarina litorea TaxID=2961595 RepID=UPI0020C4FE19|nr:DUF2298 domain-containing protein [Halomarina sp. BCD28]